MFIQLSQAIHRETSNHFFPARIYESIKTVGKEKGYISGSLMVGTITAAKVYTLAVCYFTLEGTARSFIDAFQDDRSIVRYRPLGDVGGWADIAIFSTFTLGTLLVKLIREGEYIKLKSICQKWLQENKDVIQANPKFHKNLYIKINDLLDAFNSQCLFSKSVLSRRLTALEIHQQSGLKKKNSKHGLDIKLKQTFLEIESELENISSSKQYFHRLYEGQKSVRRGSCSKQVGSLILGIAIPILLLSTVVFSYIGEFALGKELFIDKEGLTDIGHFGEWPFNAVEALGFAFFLHLWCMVNEGDFIRTQKVYAKYLEQFQKEDKDQKLHNHLCDLANKELSQMSTSCQYFKLPLDYQFEKL